MNNEILKPRFYQYHFSFVIKTYAKDMEYAFNLIRSIYKFVLCNSPIVLIVPVVDLNAFKKVFNNTPDLNLSDRKIYLISEEEIIENIGRNAIDIQCIYNTVNGGWYVQQMLKLYFALTNFSEFYLTIDSASFFTKKFYFKDYYFEGEDVKIQRTTTLKSDQDHYLRVNNVAGILRDNFVQLADSFAFIQNAVDNKSDYTGWYISGTGIFSSEYIKKLELFLFKNH